MTMFGGEACSIIDHTMLFGAKKADGVMKKHVTLNFIRKVSTRYKF